MSTHNVCFLEEIRKECQFSGKKILVGQVDFDHLLVRGQVIMFDNSMYVRGLIQKELVMQDPTNS